MIAAAVLQPSEIAARGRRLKLHRDCGFDEVSIAPLQPTNGASAPIPHAGTAHAISYLTLGGAALFAGSNRRGGARNRADRVSHALSARQIANLSAGERHAANIGLPFTRMLTIHWEAAGAPLGGMAKATGRFTDLLTKCLARHGSRTSWLWVHENGHGKGGHCHLLAHVPPQLVAVVTSRQRGWLRRITGQPYRARVIHSKPIGGRLGIEAGNPDLHAINLDAALAYVLKGASLDAGRRFGLERLEPGGCIIGKRCGISQNIGAKARDGNT